jgi:hypothetical protein
MSYARDQRRLAASRYSDSSRARELQAGLLGVAAAFPCRASVTDADAFNRPVPAWLRLRIQYRNTPYQATTCVFTEPRALRTYLRDVPVNH